MKKRIISSILISVIALASAMLIVSCGDNTPKIDKTKQYVVFDDGQGNTYKVCSRENSKIYYDYGTGFYDFTFKAYYTQNDEPSEEDNANVFVYGKLTGTGETRKTNGYISSVEPGEYTVRASCKASGDIFDDYFITVIIKEKEKITPDISFDPNGAIDYIENEKYVYVCNGERQSPIIKLSYEGEEIETKGSGLSFIFDENGNAADTTEVGNYFVDFVVGGVRYAKSEDRDRFAVVNIRVEVRIVAEQ